VTGRLDPPAGYDDDRRRIWAETIARLGAAGRLFRADPYVIDTYVQAVAAHQQATGLVAASNVMLVRDGRPIENPALAIQRRTAAQIAAASKALGLDRPPLVDLLAESPLVDATELRKWCEEHARWECSKNRTDGQPCHRRDTYKGTGACYKHAGLSPARARAAGEAWLVKACAARADADPGGVLLEEVRWSAGVVAALRDAVAELAAEPGPDGKPGSGLFWGPVRETDRGDGVVEREMRAVPHVMLAYLDRQREHLVRAAAAAHTAGAQQEAVDAARSFAAVVTRLVDALVDGLLRVPDDLAGLPGAAQLVAWQQAQVPVVVPPLIRGLDLSGQAAP
jgi:P27 family predicted phage terminase small subunit